MTAYQSATVPFGSSCVSQTRTCNSGTLSGSYQHQSCSVQPPANCPTQTLSWGTSNYCQATVSASSHGATPVITNTSAGASGSATATCNNGTWSLSGASCSVNLATPTSVSATDGTVSGAITVTWGNVSGASGYDIQYRKQGTTTWTTVANVSSGWQLTTTDESTFEFQVRAKNALGNGNWSATETGYIRPAIDPQFVSQNVPANVKAGSTFSVSQIWSNSGALTWTSTLDLGIQSATAGFTGALAKVGASTATGQQGTFNASVTAPTTPGTYNLAMNWRYNGTTYRTSPAAPVRVWGPPACNSISVSKPLTYSTTDRITVTATLGSEAASVTGARAWSLVNGQDDLRTYSVNGSGPYTFEIDLSQHSGTGNYRAELLIANPVDSGSCTIDFELRQAQPIALTLSALFGGNGSNTTFVVPPTTGPAINVAATRTDNLPLTITLKGADGTTIHTNTLSGPSASLNAAAWNTPTAWDTRSATVEARYVDDGAHAQVGTVSAPVTLMTPPIGLSLQGASSTALPFNVSAAIHQGGSIGSDTSIGIWQVKLDEAASGAAVRPFQNTADAQTAFADLDYPALWNKTLRLTAHAIPPAGITLASPYALTATLDPAIMPVRDLSATDGTREEDVRITWAAPFDGMSGVTYTLLRDGQTIASGLTSPTYDDIPPERGTVYTYSVVANALTRSSAATQDLGNLPACILPRVETLSVTGSAQDALGVLARWLACVDSGRVLYRFNSDEIEQEAVITQGNDWAAAELPIGMLPNGEHSVTFRAFANNSGMNPPRVQTFTFTINRAGVEPGNVTILYNGRPANNGQSTDSIGRFGIKLEGQGAQWAEFE